MRRPLRHLPIPPDAGFTGVVVDGPMCFPEPLVLGFRQMGPDWWECEHRHAHHEIIFVRRGAGTLLFHGRSFVVGANTILLVRPGESHGGRSDPRNPPQVLFLSFRMPHQLAAVHSPGPLFVRGPGAAGLLTELRDLCESMAAIAAISPKRIAATGCTGVLLASIMRVLGSVCTLDSPNPIRGGSERERQLAEDVLRRLELSRGCPPSLARMSFVLGITPSYLGKAFGVATGQTYPEAVAHIRMRNALLLLADPSVPMREVARRVGISGSRALARLFRRMTGKAPSAFRPT